MFRCFVVCAFGNEKGPKEERRIHDELEGIKREIFRRTEHKCAAEGHPVRIVEAREIQTKEEILLQAVKRGIDESDAVIAVLTSNNKPNVFLEIAWADVVWHRPVLLVRQGLKKPVDLDGHLHIPFDANVVSGNNPAGAEALAEQLADVLIARLKSRGSHKPFQNWPNSTLAVGNVRLYRRFSKGISNARFSRIFEDARERIVVAGPRMLKLAGQTYDWQTSDGVQPLEFVQILIQKAAEGVDVTVMAHHEDNFPPGMLRTSQRTEREQARLDLKKSFKIWSSARQTVDNMKAAAERNKQPPVTGTLRFIQLREGFLPYRVTLTEQRALLTWRLLTDPVNSGLSIDALSSIGPLNDEDGADSSVYSQIASELRHLINTNMAASEDRYVRWLDNPDAA